MKKKLIKSMSISFFIIKNILIAFTFFPLISFSKIYVNIGAPKTIKKSTIALSPFLFQGLQPNKNSRVLGQKMENRLKQNLTFSNYFHILAPEAFIEDPETKSPKPYPKDSHGFRFENWKLIGTDFLFFANYINKENKLKVTVYLYNVTLQKKILERQYTGQVEQSLKIIDKLTNDIIFSLTKKRGIFETKIISTRSTSGSQKEIFLMDWNGENKKRLTYHRSIILSPLWSPDRSQIIYSSLVYNKKLKKRIFALLSYDFKTKKIKVLSMKKGANLGSSFFPKSKSLLLTLNIGKGLSDIFKLNINSGSLQALSQGPAGTINVEPAIHPKTKQIAFSSDRRRGKAMIYTMSSRGKHIKQLTFAGNYNVSPVWHPEKNQLVFSGLSGGRMDLFSISENGRNLKRLTSLKKSNGQWANSESPSFSPDGRFLVFTSNVSGSNQLYVLALDTLAIQRITFDSYNYKSPKWSPYL